jgi:hypothetical protein
VFNDLDATLTQLINDAPAPELAELRAADVSFITPDRNFTPAQTTVNLFLYEVRENRELRDPRPLVERNGISYRRRRAPLRADCSYIVTTWAPGAQGAVQVATEHRLLGQALTWLSRFPEIPGRYMQGTLGPPAPAPIYPLPTTVAQQDPNQHAGDFWTAMGVAPRPTFYLTVTVELSLGGEITGPLVTTWTTSVPGSASAAGCSTRAAMRCPTPSWTSSTWPSAPAPGRRAATRSRACRRADTWSA